MNCTHCNHPLEGSETTCPNCGVFISYNNTSVAPATPEPSQYAPSYTETPQEIKRWNWGAFMFGACWGIGNYTYLPLLCFIPIFNLIWIFFCGAKGNEWAWKSGKFHNVEHFLAVQETWNRAGFVMFIIAACILALYILLFGLAGCSFLLY